MPLYVFTQEIRYQEVGVHSREGTPHGRGPLPTSLYKITKSRGSALGRGPPMPLYVFNSGDKISRK